MQDCLNYRKPNDSERYIYVGDDRRDEVKTIGKFILVLNTGFYLDLDKTFVVLSFK